MASKYEEIITAAQALEKAGKYGEAEVKLRELSGDMKEEDLPKGFLDNPQIVEVFQARMAFLNSDERRFLDYMASACKETVTFAGGYDCSYLESELRKLKETGADHYLLDCLLATCIYDSEDYKRAEPLLENVLRNAPSEMTLIKRSSILSRIGCCALERGDRDRARGLFLQAIEADPEDVDAKINLGVILCLSEEYSDAVAMLDGLDSKYSKLYIFRGSANYEMGNLELAVTDFSVAYEMTRDRQGIGPDVAARYASALNDYGIEQIGKEEFQKARNAFEKSLEVFPQQGAPKEFAQIKETAENNLKKLIGRQEDSMANEENTRNCQHCANRLAGYICGSASSENHKLHIDPLDNCNDFVASPAQEFFLQGLFAAMNNERISEIQAFENALRTGLPEDDQVCAKCYLGLAYIGRAYDAGIEEISAIDYRNGATLIEEAGLLDREGSFGFFTEQANIEMLQKLDIVYVLQSIDIAQIRGRDEALKFLHSKTSHFSNIKPNPMINSLHELGVLYANQGYPQYAKQCWQQVLSTQSTRLYGNDGDKLRELAANNLRTA